MKFLRNSGTDRAIDLLRQWLNPGTRVDLVSPAFSLWAFAEMRDVLERVASSRLLLGEPEIVVPTLLGSEADIVFRGQLQSRWH